ncbi:restriction endonuclease subunit S [Marinobacter persicus]|uniref:Type I restriction enzyme S subunit n=1 Tax=Marinobacter persicus TaxID=930118 RepID=A0A2S6G208_9GAMM|nr:restriction endonuclease subunit S [Marinobacter persicus]KXS52562.1 MAG: type I restriction enzyme, S subunit [Marinobacter sp. T13-3]PPK49848.1 type I restriction enzyme S subunit [Marinobacter persicus]PPK51285.1 type I restriction enzyme S subunit [Marinobacter persicus]PPK55782.1 type I restriction enzyme S subunit [Marinobacter persicus]
MSNTVPKEWQIKTVDEVATVFAGGTPSRSNPDYYEGTIPWVKSGEVNTRLIYRTEETISELAVKESSARWAKRGSVLVAMYGATAGKAARLMIDATLNQAVSAINGREKTADNWFLLYAIENNTRELLNTVQGSGQPNLSGQLIKNLNLPIPPLPEQQKIAAILSSVDDVIEKTRAQIDKLKDLKTGMMQELLTKGIGSGGVPHTEFKESPVGKIPASWDVVAISECTTRFYQGINTVADKISYTDKGTPIIQAKHMTSGQLNLDDTRSVGEADYKKYKSKFQPQKNDILFSNIGTIGKSVIIDKEEQFLIAWNVFLMRIEKNVTPKYMHYILQYLDWLKFYDDLMTGNATKFVNKSALGSILIRVPPKEEQKTITLSIDSIDKKLSADGNKLQALTKLKKALMQDLLTGRVRV